MLRRLALFFWRRQRPLALIYLVLVILFAAGFFLYTFRFPYGLDQGAVVVMRSMAYRSAMGTIERASEHLEAGRTAAAEALLEDYVRQYAETQPAQLRTEAMSLASEMLAGIYAASGRMRRADRELDQATQRFPLDYRLWFTRGSMLAAAGDGAAAADCLGEAFKLAPNHPVVFTEYISILDGLNDYERIAWANKHYGRARTLMAPRAEVKVGIARSAFQRWGLGLAGIPVEHGQYYRSVIRHGLPVGKGCVLPLPPEMFAGWQRRTSPLFVSLNFANVYEGLRIEEFRYRLHSGERNAIPAADLEITELHLPRTGSEWILEIRTELDIAEIESAELIYSCPDGEPSDEVVAIVEKSLSNYEVRKGAER